MTVSTGSFIKGFYDTAVSMGDKVVVADATLEIEGFEEMWLLIPQFPMPELSPYGEIEVPMPLGSAKWQPQQLQTAQQGSVTLMETIAGHIDQMMVNLLSQGGKFNAKIYEGTPTRHNGFRRIYDAFMQIDNPDRDWESRGEILKFTGTMFYHYFGERGEGNIN